MAFEDSNRSTYADLHPTIEIISDFQVLSNFGTGGAYRLLPPEFRTCDYPLNSHTAETRESNVRASAVHTVTIGKRNLGLESSRDMMK